MQIKRKYIIKKRALKFKAFFIENDVEKCYYMKIGDSKENDMKFVLYDDQEEFIKRSKAVIDKLAYQTDSKFEVSSFNKFDKNFENVINDGKNDKIYILDIEVPNSLSGIEVAKKIRKSDWNSIIIMVTSHTELGYEALKAQIMLLDFISKYRDWESNLTGTVAKALSQIDDKKILVLESSGMTYRIHTEDILYIIKDSVERKCTIKTTYDEIVVVKSISELGSMLDKRFYLSHRSCYINLDRVKAIDWRNNIIHFSTGETIDYLSRDRKKELKEYVRNN